MLFMVKSDHTFFVQPLLSLRRIGKLERQVQKTVRPISWYVSDIYIYAICFLIIKLSTHMGLSLDLLLICAQVRKPRHEHTLRCRQSLAQTAFNDHHFGGKVNNLLPYCKPIGGFIWQRIYRDLDSCYDVLSQYWVKSSLTFYIQLALVAKGDRHASSQRPLRSEECVACKRRRIDP